MKMAVPNHIAVLEEEQLLRAFAQIYESANLKDALQQWAVHMEQLGYNIETECS